MAPLRPPADEVSAGNDEAASQGRGPEFFMEQVMEGLSDACLLLEGTDRIVYVNSSGKSLLRPKGRILGRRLQSVLADRRLSMLAADAYHTGRPLFSRLSLTMPGERWRDDREYHVSIVPLWITTTRRLVRIALRSVDPEAAPPVGDAPAPAATPQCDETMMRLKNPLSIVQGYLENLLDGVISDPVALRQSLLTMRKHTLTIERLLDTCQKA
jgi:two-component system OmpR family sensor kinase/two-component system phosphate regulon sensor histidine kinase PhoR